MAKLKDPSQEAILDASAATYATGLTMSYAVANDVSTQTWTWNVVGTASKLLILSWPHHRYSILVSFTYTPSCRQFRHILFINICCIPLLRKVLQAPTYANIQYLTLKGYMKGVLGNKWTLKHALPTISWFSQNPVQASCLLELNRTLEVEVNALKKVVPNDFYYWGGEFAAKAQLATIAEQIGRMDLVGKVVDVLKQSVVYFFNPTNIPSAKYEPAWGGFSNGDGWTDSDAHGKDFYNDHHYCYSYLLHGAAVIGKYDPVWLQQNLDFFTQ